MQKGICLRRFQGLRFWKGKGRFPGIQYNRKRLKKGGNDFLFADAVRLAAFALEIAIALEMAVGAAGTFVGLAGRGKGPAAAGAFQQAPQPVGDGAGGFLLFRPKGPGRLFPGQTGPGGFKKRFGNDGGLLSLGDDPLLPGADAVGFVFRPVPAHLSGIGYVLQNVAKGTFFEGFALAGPGPHGVQPAADFQQGLSFQGVQMEDQPDQLRFLRDDFRRFSLVDDAVAQRGPRLIISAPGIFGHAPGDLSGQADDVIFVHPFDDSFDEASEGAFRQGFRDADNFYAAVFAEHGFIDDTFFLVPGKTAVFPYQDDVNGVGFAFGKGDHLLKIGTFVGMFS